jgi:hypothetical protein
LPEANFTFRPEFIDHSLNPLDVFGAGEGGSTQLYPLAEFELVISGKRFVSVGKVSAIASKRRPKSSAE